MRNLFLLPNPLDFLGIREVLITWHIRNIVHAWPAVLVRPTQIPQPHARIALMIESPHCELAH